MKRCASTSADPDGSKRARACGRAFKEPNRQQPFDFTRALQVKSKRERLQPLQTLCQRSILANLRSFFTLKEAPFAGLPWNLLEELVRFVQQSSPLVLTNPDLLSFFITEQTHFMAADFQPCAGNTEAAQRLLVSTLAAASPNLAKLDVRLKDYSSHSTTLVSTEDPAVMHSMVNRLVDGLENLVELRLNCYVENSTLGLIGKSCPKLKRVDIAGNKSVSNQGVFLLCPGNAPDAGRCGLIEYLDVGNTGVGLMGGVHALATLPRLRVLRHNCTYSVLKAFRERHRSKSLPCLQVLQITELPFRARVATSEHLKNVCSLVPGVTSLSLSRVPDVSPLLALKSVTKLELLQFNSVYVAQEVVQMLSAFSLLSLTISGQHHLDLSQVAIHCPLLKTLELQCPLSHSHLAYQVDRSHFRKLEVFRVRSVEMQETPIEAFEAALTSPQLQRLSLSNVVLPTRLIHGILDEAEHDGVIFGHLESVTLEHLGVESFLDKETLLLRFMAVVPTLREVCMNNNVYQCTTERGIQLVRLFAKLHRGETLRLRSNKAGLNFIS